MKKLFIAVVFILPFYSFSVPAQSSNSEISLDLISPPPHQELELKNFGLYWIISIFVGFWNQFFYS